MKKIDSQALGVLQRALGLSGTGAQITELMDGVVDQSVNVNELVRRGMTQGVTEGIYTASIQNIHGGAGPITTTVTPYDVAVGVIAPYVNPLPMQFDLWLLSATVRQASGTGTMEAVLFIDYAAAQQGWGVTSGAGAFVSSPRKALAFWDALDLASTTSFALLAGSGLPRAVFNMRIPRNLATELVFLSTSSAAASFDLNMVLGVFPTGLGQDGLG